MTLDKAIRSINPGQRMAGLYYNPGRQSLHAFLLERDGSGHITLKCAKGRLFSGEIEQEELPLDAREVSVLSARFRLIADDLDVLNTPGEVLVSRLFPGEIADPTLIQGAAQKGVFLARVMMLTSR